ncbi:MAG: glutamate formimidoyltransferase [Candidatus Fraserbacteria bacterium RBG_16_55_9]|uniref:glutamate formimidoyltransferase n=1 Tax=Fraserbacteria sp. (strain RBG_16_55_9) TaxID=1817864 RepID=A0A1F5UNR3_FRAXR|nr:MAG: glutamate formimidoyltransferase [Candidatus Fraserbacteria bacterium RBG_16_55_9]
MSKLVECIPNVSEGRDQKKIDQMAAAVRQISGAWLLDVDSDAAHNRTVITFVGAPDAVERAMLSLVTQAIELIDLREHCGEHPRMGAVDVIPFVPIKGMTMDECVDISKRVGQAIWERFLVPVYLYERSASRREREDLAKIRQGEFEGFPAKIEEPEWAPDFGDRKIHPTAGVVAVGARMPLIAFNVNLGTDDLEIAQRIAKAVRHSSGGLRYVKALGFKIEERGIVQVSMNMTHYQETPLYRAFALVQREAERYGISIVGSEIVGLVPREALYQSAEFFLQLEEFQREQVLEDRIERAMTKHG